MDAEFIINWIREDLAKMDNKLNSLDEKVNKLLEFKYKVIGGTILASLILTAAFQVVLALMQKG